MPGRLRTASRPSSTVISLAPYPLASAGVSGVWAFPSAGSTAKVSALSLATGAFDSSVLDGRRPSPHQGSTSVRTHHRDTAAANRDVTANAGYIVTGGSASTLLFSGANQRSPAPSCLCRFYRD